MPKQRVRQAAEKNRRVPWWVTRDITPLYVVVVLVLTVGLTVFVGRAPRKGSIHVCIDAYAEARTAADSARVDARRPFDTVKVRAPSCGALRRTSAYVRILREQTERAGRRGHA